jgi:hypothetical protein
MKIDGIVLVIKGWSIDYGVTIHDMMMMECWNIEYRMMKICLDLDQAGGSVCTV